MPIPAWAGVTLEYPMPFLSCCGFLWSEIFPSTPGGGRLRFFLVNVDTHHLYSPCPLLSPPYIAVFPLEYLDPGTGVGPVDSEGQQASLDLLLYPVAVKGHVHMDHNAWGHLKAHCPISSKVLLSLRTQFVEFPPGTLAKASKFCSQGPIESPKS